MQIWSFNKGKDITFLLFSKLKIPLPKTPKMLEANFPDKSSVVKYIQASGGTSDDKSSFWLIKCKNSVSEKI